MTSVTPEPNLQLRTNDICLPYLDKTFQISLIHAFIWRPWSVYQSIEFRASIRIVDVSQPNIQVTLSPPAHCTGRSRIAQISSLTGCYTFFTQVTKTRPNLSTYSRKPGNYNGTIIFEIDIMKKSSPINLNLCQT